MRSYDPDLLRKEGTKVYIDSSSVKDNAHSGWRCKTRIVVAAVKELGSYACLKIKNLSGRRGKIWGLLRGIGFFYYLLVIVYVVGSIRQGCSCQDLSIVSHP